MPQSNWYAHWLPAQYVGTYALNAVQSWFGVKRVVNGIADVCVSEAPLPALENSVTDMILFYDLSKQGARVRLARERKERPKEERLR